MSFSNASVVGVVAVVVALCWVMWINAATKLDASASRSRSLLEPTMLADVDDGQGHGDVDATAAREDDGGGRGCGLTFEVKALGMTEAP